MLKKLLGVVLIALSLYVGWTIYIPYQQAYQFWMRLGPLGISLLNAWFLMTYGWVLIVVIVLLVVGTCLVVRKGG